MREVNISKIQLELSEYDDNINKIDTKQAVKVARTTTAQLKPVVKKLTRKIILKATPVVLEEPVEEPVATPAKPKKPLSKGRKKLIIHDA